MEPGQKLVEELGPKLKTLSKGLEFDSAASGRGSVKRIYRDVRFAKDKKPYKTYFGLIFWEGEGSKKEVPAMQFAMDQTNGRFYTGMYGFKEKEVREAYRKMVDHDKSGKELDKIVKGLRKKGYEVRGEKYKRVPREYDAEHPRGDLLKYDGVFAVSPDIAASKLRNGKLVDVCYAHAKDMVPLHKWLVKMKASA